MHNLSIPALIALLATCAIARPRAGVLEDATPVPQKSRMTAFLITESGPVMECWEVDSLLPNNQQQQRNAARNMQMGVAEGGLTGVDILTWSGPTTIYPPPTSQRYHSNALEMDHKPSSFTLKGGLISVEIDPAFSQSADDDEEVETHIFSLENGDDWFYFEDQSSDSVYKTKNESPFTVSTVSGGETTLIRFKYQNTPEHKVLHKGACNFAGLSPAAQGGKMGDDRTLVRLTVQDL